MPEMNTHHHTTEDVVRQRLEKILVFWREIVGAAVLIGVVAIVIALLDHQTTAREHDAAIALVKAGMIDKDVDRHAAIEQVIASYPGTEAAVEGRIFLINGLYQKATTDAAVRAKIVSICQQFISETPDSFFVPQVRCNYARVLECDGQWEGALTQYKLAEKSGAAYILPDALLGIGRCQERLNKPEDARAAYQKVVDLQREQPFENVGGYGHPMPVSEAARFRLLALSAAFKPLPDLFLEAPKPAGGDAGTTGATGTTAVTGSAKVISDSDKAKVTEAAEKLKEDARKTIDEATKESAKESAKDASTEAKDDAKKSSRRRDRRNEE